MDCAGNSVYFNGGIHTLSYHHHHHVRLLRVVIRNRTYKTLKSLELVKVSSNN